MIQNERGEFKVFSAIRPIAASQCSQRSSATDNHYILHLQSLKFPIQNGAQHNRTTSKNKATFILSNSWVTVVQRNYRNIAGNGRNPSKKCIRTCVLQFDRRRSLQLRMSRTSLRRILVYKLNYQPYKIQTTQEMLTVIFIYRLISRFGDVPWPLLSPDLIVP